MKPVIGVLTRADIAEMKQRATLYEQPASGLPHPQTVPKHPEEYKAYVNKDVTVMVEPMRNHHWIRDDSHGWKHAAHMLRGSIKDNAGLMRTRRHLDVHPAPPLTFTPSITDIDALPKFGKVGPCVDGNGKTGFARYERRGELPAISQLKYWGLDQPTDVEPGQWRPSSFERFFDQSGVSNVQVDRFDPLTQFDHYHPEIVAAREGGRRPDHTPVSALPRPALFTPDKRFVVSRKELENRKELIMGQKLI